jgi:hypothetical protein
LADILQPGDIFVDLAVVHELGVGAASYLTAVFGMSSQDDGSRDDPLLSDRSWAVSSYRPDLDALAAAPTRIVIAVGEESLGTFTARASVATAELLGQQATLFPGHQGGFLGGEFGYAGQPEAFALKLREVLDNDTLR